MEYKEIPVRLESGPVVSSATAYVYISGTTTEATVYDISGAEVSQPLTTGANGVVGFSAANGEYDVSVSASGTSVSLSGIRFFDPDESGFATSASVSALDAEVTTLQDDVVTIDARLDVLESVPENLAIQGGWDASSGSFPSSTLTGEYWIVETAGTVDGVTFAVNDELIAIVDAASTTTYSANWFKKSGGTITQSDIDLKADLASPTFTGTVTVPTATAGDDSTAAASTAFVQGEIASSVSAAGVSDPAADSIPRSTPATESGKLRPDWISRAITGLPLALAERPELKDCDFIADFRHGAYAQSVSNGHITPVDFDEMFYRRVAAPTTRAGLAMPSSTSRKNLCRIGLNDPDFEGFLKVNGLTVTVVEIADVPTAAREYFEGLSLVWPVERVFRVVNSTGRAASIQALMDPTPTITGDRTASAYIYPVAGNVRASTGAIHGTALTPGTGARSVVSATSGTSLQIRTLDGTECYFCAPQFELAASVTAYEDALDTRERLVPRAGIVGSSGTILCQVDFASVSAEDSTEIFSISDISGAANSRPSKVLRCYVNWSGGGGVVLVADDGVAPAVSVNRNFTFAPGIPVNIACTYTEAGVLALSIDGGPESVSTTGGLDLSGIDRLRLGSADNLAPANVCTPLGGNLIQFAYKGA